MENTLPQHTGDEPSKLSFGQLKEMTNNFANEIGRGSFGIVYKGVNSNGKEIAFKKLKITGIDDSLFQKEFQNLKRLKHPNIVELVGFCNESEKFVTEYEGKLVTAEEIHTVLCFEYVSNGSLASHLHDEHTGLSWQKRYRIIKGICDGLKYLRDGLEFSVWHLDLKPDNILLGETMIPKIADFGLSKLLGEDQTRKSINSVGTRGYWPPEYVNHQIISKEFDIFSLGVIMTKVMIGSERYKSIADMPPRKFVKQVHDNWKKRLQEVLRTGSLEVHCQQVKTCIEIAMECLRPNRQERPIIKDIVFRLNETETMIGDLGLHVQEVPYRSLDQSIENDLKNLMRLKHQNVVQLLGFCDEEVEELADYQGRLVRAIRRHTAICLESLPNKSLHEFLFEKHDAHSWDLCFDIIKGICSGLKYLHDATIMHLDLKPETILLDEKMVPKIGSYGLSRIRNSATLGKMSTVRTIEYLPPEYITKQVISDKYDIYSLGVIIMKIVIRGMDYRLAADMDERELIEQVQDHWKRILLEIPNYPSIEEDCDQVRVCIQIAMLCRKEDRRKRPTLEDIVQKLNAVETKKNDSCAQIDQPLVTMPTLAPMQ
ncbi:G-type lectin S-receptor-like serine/threonine-protein kinase At1g61390 [Lolium rigidum]|uniref:G-type lectin S-receptor-like serine/threonine-protein kinase At1g61390 n=1 Tax=Lolium rigidum TaxID=89674 RepID=UPI001F5C320A|nr:G-type lectin S-receptor-like serine/threonine-protein kinase At1g61390 [Lolium rigidum]